MDHSELETRGYSLPMRILHWLMAIIMITMLAAGLYMVNGPWDGKFPPARGWLFDYHRGMGFVLMVLVIVRLVVYRFSTPPSPLPATMEPMQKRVAGAVHFLLYLSLIIQPLFGWYATNLWGVKHIPVFGLFHLPTLVEKNRELGETLLSLHGYLGFAIAGLIALHIAGALYHALILKDGVIMRMIRQ